jgi:serpin B
MALAMARVGARGKTAAEMDAVLHAPTPTPGTLDAGLLALDQALAAYSGGDGSTRPVLAAANSLWAQRGLTLEAAFRETLATYYGAQPQLVDFRGATEAARLAINSWVGERTNSRIPELLADKSLAPSTMLVLVNALCLKAGWAYPFDTKATADASFTPDFGPAFAVPTMTLREQRIGYAAGDGWLAVELPYVGSKLAMAIVVPTRGTLAGLESTISGAWLTKLLTGFGGQLVQLRLPRWKFRCPLPLANPLAELGMPTAFTDSADFSGITRDMPLLIDKVVQETFIAVDEKGTEAAAATAIVVRPPSVETPKPVTIDRPFLFVIHDVATATPLFMGRVANPAR